MPSVVAAERDFVAASRSPGDSDGGAGDIGSCLRKAHPVCTGDDLLEAVGQVHFQRMHQRENHPVMELPKDGLVDPRIGMAQQNGSEREGVVDILVPVDIPDVAPASPLQVDGIDALNELIRSFAEGLRTSRDEPNRLLPEAQ